MLDTTCSNDCPLFSTSTMAMTSGIVIQRPLPTESYSWSDFPIVLQDDSASATTFCNHHCGYEYNNSMSSSSNNNNSMSNNFPSMASTSTLSTASSTSTMSVASVSASSSSLSSSASSKKNVRFAPSPKVRTYSVVLGDHPLCDDGLAIELGWDYSDEDENHESHHDGMELEDNMEEDVLRHSRNSCQKRSYLSRKQLLLDVAGCTKEELDQRTKDLETQRSLRQQAQAYRDDYYYLLAFAKR